MNISEELDKLKSERSGLKETIRSADERVKAINLTIRKLETQKKKFEAILGENQKGIAE